MEFTNEETEKDQKDSPLSSPNAKPNTLKVSMIKQVEVISICK